MQRPLIYLAVALIAGIAVGYFVSLSTLFLLTILGFIFLLLLFVFRRKLKILILPLAAISLFVLGILDINLSIYKTPEADHIVYRTSGEKLTVEGIIDAPPEESPEGTTVIVAVRNIIMENRLLPANGRVMLSLRVDYPMKYGDLVRFKSRLRKPRNFNNPGGFDYEKQLRGRGILVQGSINSAADIILIREACGNPFKIRLENIRSNLRKIIEGNADTPHSEIIQALLLGEKKRIPPPIREAFNRTGTSHILAISGLHVGMVASFFIFFILLLMKTSPYLLLRFNALKISTCLALIPIIVYAFIAGFGVSVIRATVMILVFLTAILLRKERELFNTLALAALLILLFDPVALFDISFQLSFTAVASLIYIGPFLAELYPEVKKRETAGPVSDVAVNKTNTDLLIKRAARNIFLFLSVSLSATVGTIPLIVYYFNGLSTVSLLANCIIIPLMGMVTLPIGMGIIITAPVLPALSAFLVKAASLSLIPSLAAINYLASLPFSFITLTTPSFLEITCFYLLLITLITIIRKKRENNSSANKTRLPIFYKFSLFALIIFFICDALYLAIGQNFRQHLEVTAIDVGQGSAMLLRLPKGKDLLVDGGGSTSGSFDIGKYVLAPYLWRQRISRLETVVLTHPHPDHLQGLIYILEKFPVREVWMTGYAGNDELYKNFLKLIKERKVIVQILGVSTKPFMMNGVDIAILNPQRPLPRGNGKQDFREANDSSLVMRLTFGKITFLFPGDISGKIESLLISEGKNIKSDVLFVGHHGGFTSTSTAFLQAVRPCVAVISCGRDNTFNLPHPQVLERLAAFSVRIWRTDINGAVRLSTNGHELRINSAISNK